MTIQQKGYERILDTICPECKHKRKYRIVTYIDIDIAEVSSN